MVRCRRGVHALEFAVVATVLIPMLMGAMEMALQSATAVALDYAALKASRAGSLGRETPDGTRKGEACPSAILEAARRAGSGLLNGDLQIGTFNYASAKNAVEDGSGRKKGSKGAGLGGHTVVYELRYEKPSVFMRPITIAGSVIGREKYVHTAVITVQNEPFADGDPRAPRCS